MDQKPSAASCSAASYDVIVLGAGVVGVNTAYWAMRAGKSVCVIERQPEAGLETSFANGGQISVSHAEPWANPGAPGKILKWMFDGDAPLLFRPRMDWRQWWWIAQFVVDCLPQRASKHTIEIVQLARQSRALLQEIRAREHIHYSERTQGILHFYRDAREFDAAIPVAELMRKYGCNRRVVDRDEVLKIEPALAPRIGEIVGATYTAEDESGDAHAYTQELAKVCARGGVDFLFGTSVVALQADKRERRIGGVEISGPSGYRTLKARNVIVSLGSYSAPFLEPYSVHLNIYPAKGYSVTIPFGAGNMPPQTSLTDDEYKLVYSNLGDRLRVAGTAELSGYSRALNHARCEAILRNARSLFPDAGEFGQATFWTGLRPATPSNVPYVCGTAYANLWLNTGHGTLGWTMGAGSGKRIVDLMIGSSAAHETRRAAQYRKEFGSVLPMPE
jgi:D-amino-acid dehydrogenase